MNYREDSGMSGNASEAKPSISISIVNYNSTDYLLRCLHSIKNSSNDLRVEILVLDNASRAFDPEEIYRIFPKAMITINKKNKGFAYAHNQNFSLAGADVFFLLNPDTLLTPGSLQAILETFAIYPEAAIVGLHPVSMEGKSLLNVKEYPTLRSAMIELFYLDIFLTSKRPCEPFRKPQTYQQVECITGAAFAVRSDIYGALDGLDQDFFMYFEEADFCKRMKDVFDQKIILLADVKILHFLGRSTIQTDVRQTLYYESYYRYFKKHHGVFPSLVLRICIGLGAFLKIIGIQIKYFPCIKGWETYAHKMFISLKLLSWAVGIMDSTRKES